MSYPPESLLPTQTFCCCQFSVPHLISTNSSVNKSILVSALCLRVAGRCVLLSKVSCQRVGDLSLSSVFTLILSRPSHLELSQTPAQLWFLHPQDNLRPAPWTAAKTPAGEAWRPLLERHGARFRCSRGGGLLEDTHCFQASVRGGRAELSIRGPIVRKPSGSDFSNV